MAFTDLFRRAKEGLTAKVVKIVASRAVYESADIQRCEVKVELEGKHELTMEMSLDQVATLVRQLTAVYEACRPGLRPDLRGTGSQY